MKPHMTSRLSGGVIVLLLAASCVSANATVLFRDNFEYDVSRNQAGGASNTFQASGGWTWAKTRQDAYGIGSNGYFYTVNSMPGYAGRFPGSNSNRVLCMEFLPATLGGQTDAYLALGGPSFPVNKIPSNVWFQFWVYFQRYPGQMSRQYNMKFLYPSVTGDYPANPDTGLDWLFLIKEFESYNPYWNTASQGEGYFLTEAMNDGKWLAAPTWDQWKLGPNISSGVGVIRANTWVLLRIHFDTSGASPLAPAGQGVWRMWTSTNGATFTQVANWIGGVTPQFVWPVTNTPQGGHRALKLGTTANAFDSWIYMDDFVMATSESSLPTYVGSGSLPAPTNLRLQ